MKDNTNANINIRLDFLSLSNAMSVMASWVWRVWISFAASSRRSAILSGFPSCTDFRVLICRRICALVLSL